MIPTPFTRKLKVTRQKTKGIYVNGYFQAGATQTFWIMASVQPMSARERLTLSEGDRVKESKKLYLETCLFVGSEECLKTSDIVEIDAEDFDVAMIDDWTSHLALRHFKAVVVRRNENDEEGAA